MSVRADVETFRSIPIFAECDPVHLQLLAFSAARQAFETGERLITEGERGSAAYLILNGHVDLSSALAGRIGTAGPGALLGEIAMIGNTAYSLTARASEPLSTARIERALFMRVAQEFPDFGAAVFNALARKLDLSVSDLDLARRGFEQARSFRSL
ncbi:cyclic nucleotide-binding domain-containing protein [Aestuariivirga sp.]|uniref:cyclic nucleotide-binding domain-containing protein n=1 Tax=Aestuariivirga sp. TaxID=2650926 RepID=UPI00391D7213